MRRAGRRRYPEHLRTEIEACVRAMRDQGFSWAACESALGINKMTLLGWQKKKSAAGARRAMVPVALRAETTDKSTRDLTLRTPNGIELRGLDLSEAAQLLRVLG
jgi:hypothetical protein